MAGGRTDQHGLLHRPRSQSCASAWLVTRRQRKSQPDDRAGSHLLHHSQQILQLSLAGVIFMACTGAHAAKVETCTTVAAPNKARAPGLDHLDCPWCRKQRMRMGDGHASGAWPFDQLRRIAQGFNCTGGAGERPSFGLNSRCLS